MMYRGLLILALAGCALAANAADDLGAVAFRQAQLDLGHDSRLLCLAAHPDDEDGATLAYYRKKYGVKTFALIATRGEGGQNEIGPELYEELGVIRTHEMTTAAAIEGAELHFLDLPEFGFSKTTEETLAIWGKETALRKMVAKLRALRPHVVITHHGRMKDHGHHQAIGQILLEAFDAAADPAVFPDLLSPWQVQRLYIRNWEGVDADAEIPISELEPLRGKTYAEIAADALRAHKSQGMEFFIERLLTGRPSAFYDLVKSSPKDEHGEAYYLDGSLGPLFEGIPMTLRSGDSKPRTTGDLKDTTAWQISRATDPPESIKVQTLEYLAKVDPAAISPQHDEALHRLAAAATELRLSLRLSDTRVVAGQSLTVHADLTDFGVKDSASASLHFEAFGSTVASHTLDLADATTGAHAFTLNVPAVPLTLPHAEHLFEPGFLEPQLTVIAKVQCGNAIVLLTQRAYVDVAPAIDLAFPDAPWLNRADKTQTPIVVDLLVSNRTPGPASGEVSLSAPVDWQVSPPSTPVHFQREDEQQLARFIVTPAPGASGNALLHATTKPEGNAPYERTGRVESLNLELPKNANVGVVQSYDDTFVKTLDRLRIPHRALEQQDFSIETLREFSAIILDIRAYQERPDLVSQNDVFLQYASEGGTLLVMYNKTFEWEPHFAPYPIQLSRNRVTVEDTPITVLEPDHPLFHRPNKIETSAWQGWIQEWGLYFPDQWDQAYTPLIAMSDPGEDIPPGSLLVAKTGKGVYLYTALSLYRQLRELHPGALRIFANMLAL